MYAQERGTIDRARAIDRTRAIDETLLAMLSYRRPHGSPAEAKFIRRFIKPLGVETDGFGNLIKRIGNAPVLWSCHVDTVHVRSGRQRVAGHNGVISLPKASRSRCLGADDAAGVWLMCQMIEAGVEGLYIFHRAEERGGQGSAWIAENTPELLDGIDAAIALDRKGRGDVITHQFGECCSADFAEALASELGACWLPDDTGVFTDTANYDHLVSECTNLSVGYEHEHTPHETLDAAHLMALRDTLVALDTSRLPIVRDPYADITVWEEEAVEGSILRRHDDNAEDFIRVVSLYPRIAALLLDEYGITKSEFIEEVYKFTGYFPA